MLERFTSRARHVIVLAIQEARSRGHETVGPEHLLLGILRDGGGMAIRVLMWLQARPENLRADLERLLSEAARSSAGSEPVFSPALRAVFEAALESRFQSHHVIGTENLLLGLLTYEGSEANRILRAAGAETDSVRQMISFFYGSRATTTTAEAMRLIATSKWRVEM